MREKIVLSLTLLAACTFAAFAQNDVNVVLEEAASAFANAPKVEAEPAPAPSYWTKSAVSTLKFVQTSLTNWAAGGDNTTSLSSNFDASANYKNKDYYGNNRLQLDYGFLYASSKPILQKNVDRIYLDCTWGRKAVKNLSYTANFNFKSQFTKGWNYSTPATKKDDEGNVLEPTHADWRDARKLKSAFLSPATANLALGFDYRPKPWLTVNFSPLTGSFTIVTEQTLRSSYGMNLSAHNKQLKEDYASVAIENLPSTLSPEEKRFLQGLKDGKEADFLLPARFDFGAQLKVDVKFVIDKKITCTSQLMLFSNYLKNPENMRVNWDNKVNMPLSKYLSLTFDSWMTYDDTVMIFSDKDQHSHQRIQFKESLSLAFQYKF